MTDPAAEDQIPPGGEPMTEFTWDSWTPQEVASRLAGLSVSWAFAGGWAVDLFAGSISREHEDVEVAMLKASFAEVRRALRPYEFDLIGAGRKWPISDSRAYAITHQTWLRDPDTGVYKLDVFREPHDRDVWICRRDPSIRRLFTEIVHQTEDGLPYVAPEVVLLFKARQARPKDEHDLERALPLMDADSRSWLRESIGRVHPGHAWLARI